MGRVTKFGLGLSALLFSSIACANFSLDNFCWDEWEFNPSVGFDVNLRQQRFNSGFGEEHFREDYPDTNFYLAARIHRYLGVEVGYEHMYRQNKNQYYNANQAVLGAVFVPDLDANKLYFSNAYSNGWNVNLVGFWPICPRTGTDIMFTLGVSWLKMFYETVAVTDDVFVSEKNHWESNRRGKIRAGIGVKQMITKNFGARLQVMWEKGSNLGASTDVAFRINPSEPPLFYTAEPKNSVLYGLGFFLQLC